MQLQPHLVVFALSAATLAAVSAGAQAPPPQPDRAPRVEAWLAAAAVPWTPTGKLTTSYPPEVALISGAEGRLGQTLTLEPSLGRGVEFGLNAFPQQTFGVQVFASRVAADVGGVNTPFDIDLRYVSWPPPDNVPTPVSVARSVAWPDTVGRLRQWTLGAGPAVRWQRPGLAVVASGGLAWVRLDGTVQPLGYTTFRLGGHSVLFEEDYRVGAALGPTSVLAGFVSGGIDVCLGRHVAATMGLRVLVAGDAGLPATIDTIVDATAGLMPPLPADVDRLMAPVPARQSPQRVALTIGLKLR